MDSAPIYVYLIYPRDADHESCLEKIYNILNSDECYKCSYLGKEPGKHDIDYAIRAAECRKIIVLVPNGKDIIKEERMYWWQVCQAKWKDVHSCNFENALIYVTCHGEVQDDSLVGLLEGQEILNIDDPEIENKLKVMLHCKIRGKKMLVNVPKLPKYYVIREDDENEITDLLRKYSIVGIKGMGGIGKTTLAAATVTKWETEMKVYWVNFSTNLTTSNNTQYTQDSALSALNQMYKNLVLCGTNVFSNVGEGRTWLEKYSKDRKLLLVLDNVSSEYDADAFNVLGRECKMLITTRNEHVISKLQGRSHHVGPLKACKAFELFVKRSKFEEDNIVELKEFVEKVLKNLQGLPLAITLVASTLYSSTSSISLVENLRKTIDRLDVILSKASLLRSEYDKIALKASFDISFKALEGAQGYLNKGLSLIQEILIDCAIFCEGANMISTVFHKLKCYDSGREINQVDVKDCLDILVTSSLLSYAQTEVVENIETPFIIHDLLLKYVKDKASSIFGDAWLSERHRTLLLCYCDMSLCHTSVASNKPRDCHEIGNALDRIEGIASDVSYVNFMAPNKNYTCREWWTIEDQNGYLFKYLAFHLLEGGLHEELSFLLLEYKWYIAKIEQCDIVSLISDFEQLKKSTCSTYKKDHELLLHTFEMSAAEIAKNKSSLPRQLLGRLLGYPTFESLCSEICTQASSNRSSHFMLPISACLHSPDWYLYKDLSPPHGEHITALGVFNDEVITGSSVFKLRTLNPETRQENVFGQNGQNMVCALGFKSNCGVSASVNESLMTPSKPMTIAGHLGMVTVVSIDFKQRFIISGSTTNGYPMLYWAFPDKQHYDVRCIKPIMLNKHTKVVRSIKVSKDGNYIVSGSSDKTICIWKVNEDHTQPPHLEHVLVSHTEPVLSVCITSDCTEIVSVGADSRVILWDLKRGKLLSKYQNHSRKRSNIIFHCVDVHTFSDGVSIALVGAQDKTIKIFKIAQSLEFVKELDSCHELLEDRSCRHTDEIMCIKIVPEKDMFVSACRGGTLCVWSLTHPDKLCGSNSSTNYASDFKIVRSIKAHSYGIWCLSILYKDNDTFILTSAADHSIKMWRGLLAPPGQDMSTCQRNNHTQAVTDIACSSAGEFAVTVSRDGHMVLHDLSQNKTQVLITRRVTSDNILLHSVCVSNNPVSGSFYLFLGDGKGSIYVYSWDKRNGKLTKLGNAVKGHGFSIRFLAVSPDDNYLFAGSVDNIITVFKLQPDGRICQCASLCNTHFYGCTSLSFAKRNEEFILIASFIGGYLEWNISHIHKVQKHLIPIKTVRIENDFKFPVIARTMSKVYYFGSDQSEKIRQLRLKIHREVINDSKLEKGDIITCLCSSQNEEFIVVGSESGKIRLFPADCCVNATNDPIKDIPCAQGSVIDIKISANMDAIFACFSNGDIYMCSNPRFDRDSSKHCKIGTHRNLRYIELVRSRKTKHILVSCDVQHSKQSVFRIWNVWKLQSFGSKSVCHQCDDTACVNDIGTVLHKQKFNSAITSITSSYFVGLKRDCLFLGFSDGSVCSFRLEYDQNHVRLHAMFNIEISKSAVKYLLLTKQISKFPGLPILIVGLQENNIKLLDANSGRTLKEIPTGSSFDVHHLAVTGNGKELMVCYETFLAELIDIKSGELLHRMRTYRTNWRSLVSVSDGKHIIVNSTRSSGAIYCIPNTCGSELIHLIPKENQSLLVGHSRRLTAAYWISDSKMLTGSYDKCLKLWDISGKGEPKLLCQYTFEHTITKISSTSNWIIVVGLETGQVNVVQLFRMS